MCCEQDDVFVGHRAVAVNGIATNGRRAAVMRAAASARQTLVIR
jgi:hypothetical protein